MRARFMTTWDQFRKFLNLAITCDLTMRPPSPVDSVVDQLARLSCRHLARPPAAGGGGVAAAKDADGVTFRYSHEPGAADCR
jgi:hypothetical protein